MTGMDMIHDAAKGASMAFETHWRRGFLEKAHDLIRCSRHTANRLHIDTMFLDIEAVIDESPCAQLYGSFKRA